MRRGVLLLGALLLATAGGCHASGTWTDEDANWRRAFGQDLPPGVALVHSRYWRSGHFFREEAYFFAFTAPADFESSLRAENAMSLAETAKDRAALASASCFDRPAWFPEPEAPGLRAWRTASGTAALYQDSNTSVLFLAVCQL